MDKSEKCISLYENKAQIMTAAIDKIVVSIFNKRTNFGQAQVVLFTGCAPLAGTTSTCISIGIAMANTQRRTLLIDCDMRKILKYKKLNEQASNGLAEYLLQDTAMEAVSTESVIYDTNIDNLYYIPCGNHLENSTRMLCSSRMVELLEDVRNQFDCIILDMPSITVVPDSEILFGAVDGIALVASLGETRKSQIKEAKRKVAPFADRYYGIIANKVELDQYRWGARNYDYYFVDKKGEQNLEGSSAHKKYKKALAKKGGTK